MIFPLKVTRAAAHSLPKWGCLARTCWPYTSNTTLSLTWKKQYEAAGSNGTRPHYCQISKLLLRTAPPPDQLRILSMPGPNFEIMNRNQQYNFAMRTLKSLADTLADFQPDIFARRLGLLEDLNSTWLKGGEEKKRDCSINLATSSDSECDTPAAENPHSQAVEVENMHKKPEEAENAGQAIELENVQEKAEEPDNPGQAIVVENVQEKAEETGKSCPIKLPVVKSRGRPAKRIRQRTIKRKRQEEGPAPFKDLSLRSQEKCKRICLLQVFWKCAIITCLEWNRKRF